MKKLVALLIAGALSASTSFAASFTLNGSAVSSSALGDYAVGDTIVYVVAGGGGGAFSTAGLESLTSALSLAVGESLGGYEIAFTSTTVGGGGSTFAFGGTLNATASAGDAFGLLVFDSSTTSTTASDSYTIFNDSSWVLPAAGGSFTFGGSNQPISITSGGTTSSVAGAVPEPSSYALFGGLFALTCVMLRRRA